MVDGYYDVHCHILPGVDDGARTMEDALRMLRISWKEGIRHVVVTPHFHVGHYETPMEVLRERFEELRRQTWRELPEMNLYLGCEICYHMDAGKKLARGELLTMGGTKNVLVEFLPKSGISTIQNGLQEIQMAGKQPILAHAERYRELLGNYDAIEKFIQMGFYIQVNASAVAGQEGFRIKQFVKKLLDYEMVHLIGTDAHDPQHRKPAIRDCATYIERKWGSDYVEELLVHNPDVLLKGFYLND